MIAFSLLAQNPGDEVIVIYNKRVPESKAVAEYYAKKRDVPKDHLFGFSLSTGENMSRSEFEHSLQKPLAKELEKRKLWKIRAETFPATSNSIARVMWKVRDSKIRYAVICYGVPYRIPRDTSIREIGAEKLREQLRRNEASVDSELALLPAIEQNLPLTGPLRNPLYGSTNEAAFYPSNDVLMVTRLDGPTPEIARGLVDKAMEAETNGLWGRAYIDIRNTSEPGYKMGDDWMRGTAEICRMLGFETVVDTNAATFPAEFPMSQIAFYAGWYTAGDASGSFARPNVEFLPGAFAYHLFSYSAANLRSMTKDWVGPLLAKGATITMGCVDEPYLSGTPDIAIFAGRFLYQGLSFGEAAYASQSVLSWQTVFIGDPLYRPFKIPPEQLHKELAERQSKWLQWSFLRLVNLNIVKGVPLARVASFLNQIKTTKESAVLTEKLGDLYSDLGKPSSAVEMWQRALELDPSPEQRVRLRLDLAEKLVKLDQNQDAVEDLAKLLEENPDYPAKINIYRKLLPLAKKLGKTEAAENYEKRIRELSAK